MLAIYTMVGMQYRGADGKIVQQCTRGEEVLLRRDPKNRHDPNAVQVWIRDRHCAYIKASEAKQLAERMDFADKKNMIGHLVFDGDRWPKVEVNES